MDENQARYTEMTVLLNTVIASIPAMRRSMISIADDISHRPDQLKSEDHLNIGWQLGWIDSYLSNLNSVLDLYSNLPERETVPSFSDTRTASPIERVIALIDYLDDVEAVLSRLSITYVDALDGSAMTDHDIRSWMTIEDQ